MGLGFTHSYRNARALAVIGALLGVLGFGWIASSDKIVATTELTAGVLEVIEYRRGFQARVAASNGREVRIFLPMAGPRRSAGDQIPLIAEHYSDGSTLYRFDQGRWIANAGAVK